MKRAGVAADTSPSTEERMLAAARACLLRSGYAAVSTRAVAEEAGVPLSQIHYYFGSKRQLLLTVLESENARLLERQRALYAGPELLSVKWQRACDYLDEDLHSGYVRILHELWGQSYSDPDLAVALREAISGWHELLAGVIDRAFAQDVLQRLGLTPAGVAALLVASFLGAEIEILLGLKESQVPHRGTLRNIGRWIEANERRPGSNG